MRGKPTVGEYLDKSGKRKSENWYIFYFDGQRSRRVSTGYRIGKEDHEANLALAQFIIDREKPLAREPGKLLVEQALRDYYEEHAQFTVTVKMAKVHEKRITGHLKGQFVSQITPANINSYVRKCQEKEESNGTIRRDLDYLQAALNHEVREQRLLYAPKFKKPSPPPPRDRVLTNDEIERLLAHCKVKHLENFIKIMLATGQRPSAVEQLKWFQIDFPNRLIRFDKASKHKNKLARPVPMNNALYDLLNGLDKIKTTEYVLEFVQENKKKGTRKVRPAGSVRKAFEKACTAAGLSGVSRYTLRHTWGTSKYLEGWQDKDIADIMGHTTAKTTATHYMHTQMERLRTVVESANTAQKVRKTKNAKT